MKFLVIAALLLIAALVLCLYQYRLIKGDSNHVRRGYAIMTCFLVGLGMFEIWLRFVSEKEFTLNLPMAIIHLPVAAVTFFWFLLIGATGITLGLVRWVWKKDFEIVQYGIFYSLTKAFHYVLIDTKWPLGLYSYSLVTGVIFLAVSYYG